MKLTRRSFFGALMAAPPLVEYKCNKYKWKEYSVPIKADLQDDLTRVTLEYIHKREQDLIRSMWGKNEQS